MRSVAGAQIVRSNNPLKLLARCADKCPKQEAPMHENPPNHHSIRRIVLPSGRAIEVLRFQETAERPRLKLHVCPECRSELVQPVAWSEAPQDRWELTLRCPNCDWLIGGVFDQEQVHELEDRLDDGLSDMLRDLRRLTQANMAEEIDRFSDALQTELILPEDL
jgi:hypothetical protein